MYKKCLVGLIKYIYNSRSTRHILYIKKIVYKEITNYKNLFCIEDE